MKTLTEGTSRKIKRGKNKVVFATILLAGVLMLMMPSCKKYPDGPFISLHSKTERVAQTWRVGNYLKNGTDNTSMYSNYSETYTKQGSYSYSWGVLSGSGTWAFTNDASDIQLTGTSNQNSYTLVILKLEQNAFWYYYMDGADKKEFHMVH
jgi:hypothetical protein